MGSLKVGMVGASRALAPLAHVISDATPASLSDVAPSDRDVLFPGTRLHESAEALLRSGEAGVVVLAAGTRNAYLASLSLQEQRHVIMLPPWRLTPTQVDELYGIAASSGCQLLFSQPIAWSPEMVRMRHREPGAVQLRGARGTLVSTDPEGMAELVEQALCLARLLSGDDPEAISAAGGMKLASLQLFYPSNHGIHFSLSAGEPRRERAVTLIGDGYSRRFDLDQREASPGDLDDGRVMRLRRPDTGTARNPTGVEAVHLLRCLLHDETPLFGHEEVSDIAVGVEDARRSLLALGAPVSSSPRREARAEAAGSRVAGRPKLRLIVGGGRSRSGASAHPALTIVS